MRTPNDAATATWQCASLLLDYPNDALVEQFAPIRRTLAALPPKMGRPLTEFMDHAERQDRTDLQQDYVATFDSNRRCSLFLTYFAHGDTRQRGVALLRFQQAYRAAGVHFAAGELPDHLAVVLEFAGTVDPIAGRRLLLDHRAALETLRLALVERRSHWAGVLAAVCGTLPALRGDEQEAIARLAAEGPPTEEVGMTPYGAPAFDPASRRSAGVPVQLPMPKRRTA